MPAPVLSLLLQLILHSGEPALTRPDSTPEWMTGTPRITVTAETPPREREVRISPGRGLLLVFDTPVRREGLVLQEREHFRQASLSEDGLVLTLIPPDDLPMGRRLGLRVRFVDGEIPASLDLLLVVHPMAEFQVEVFRRSRPGESYQREAEETRAQLAQCQTALSQERAERQEPSGLMGLLAMDRMGKEGIRSKNISRDLAFRPEDVLGIEKAISYRARGGDRVESRVRLALDLTLVNTGLEPWRPTKAQLVGRGGRWMMDIWAPEPLAPGASVRVLVEVELPETDVPTGPSLLRLWDEEGTRLAVVSGVTFP